MPNGVPNGRKGALIEKRLVDLNTAGLLSASGPSWIESRRGREFWGRQTPPFATPPFSQIYSPLATKNRKMIIARLFPGGR